MNAQDLQRSASTDAAPPDGLALPLQALWWERHGDWEKAHEIAQSDETGRDAAWVHAYLHRREGDPDNAGYWYLRAGQPVAVVALDAEWDAMAAALLDRGAAR